MNDFWNSYVYAVIKAMKRTGNQQGVVADWIALVSAWAHTTDPQDSAALRAWLPHWQVRPFYTAAELAPIFPAIAVALGIAKKLPLRHGVGRLENELIYGGLPVLQNANGTDKFLPALGPPQRFFIVERIPYWRDKVMTQAEFDHALFNR